MKVNQLIQLFVFCFCLCLTTSSHAEDQAYKKGDVIFTDTFGNEASFKQNWSGAVSSCELTKDGLKIAKTSTQKDNTGLIQVQLPVERLRGMTATVKARIKGEKVTPATPAFEGTRFLTMMKANGAMMYKTHNLPVGTFDWQEVEMEVYVPDDSNGPGFFKVGLDRSSGTLWIKDFSITITEIAQTDAVAAGERYKGHSLPALRGITLPNEFSEQDYIDLGKWNVNCGRWNIGRWDGGRFPGGLAGKQFDALFEKEVTNTDRIIALAKKQGIYVVLCMGGSSPKFGLFDSPQNQSKFIECWKQLAERYKNEKMIVMYDLCNEPIADEWKKENGVKTYQELMLDTALAIRALDPQKCIAVEPATGGSKPEGFYTLKPLKVSNVIYSPHMYGPMGVTHQGLFRNPEGVTYPGMVEGALWDKAQLERYLKPAIEFQKRYNVQMYVGEMSCIRWAPDGSAARWLSDSIDIFEKYGWDWSFHAFREYDGWDVEYVDGTHEKTRTTELSGRAKVLRSWYDKNQKPDWYKNEK